MNIYQRIENLRKALFLDKGEVCDLLGISRTMLHYIKKGERYLSPKSLKRLEDEEIKAGLAKKKKLVVREDRALYITKGENAVNILEELDQLKKDVVDRCNFLAQEVRKLIREDQ